MSAPRLGVDVGGTFTDLVAFADGELVSAKVPSTPADQSRGVMTSIAASGIEPGAVAGFAHGMTVATNALLERRGARTALVTTEGFRDLIEIGRQSRPALYDLTARPPAPLVPRDLRLTVTERMGPDGPLVPLDEESVRAVTDALRLARVESVAVCLLFAFLHPAHERRVGEILRERLEAVHVSLSSEVLPEFREYERLATTTADAYLAPRLASYLSALAAEAERAALPSPLVMRSSGGVAGIAVAARQAAACVLSGPAGGVVGAGYAAAASGYADVLTFDMGGTSTDVAPILGGEVQTTTESVVAGVPIKFPMVDVHSVSAGGGSIAWADPGGALRVGPQSAGAEPGPAAYDAGGVQPTVTDADLFLGYLADGARLGGTVTLRRPLAERALRGVGDELGLDPLATALGIVGVANAEMARALRVISVERGLDPRDFALVAFGGAGGMHACALAEELGIATVLVPRASGVLSALGLACSDVRRDYVQPLLAAADVDGLQSLSDAFDGLEQAARGDLERPRLARRADLRYRGQSFEITVDADRPEELVDRFHAAHERRYGYRMEAEPAELVNARMVATVPVEKPPLREARVEGNHAAGRRAVNFDGEAREVDVLARCQMGAGSPVQGPAILEFAEATCVIRPGWGGAIDDAGTLVLERG